MQTFSPGPVTSRDQRPSTWPPAGRAGGNPFSPGSYNGPRLKGLGFLLFISLGLGFRVSFIYFFRVYLFSFIFFLRAYKDNCFLLAVFLRYHIPYTFVHIYKITCLTIEHIQIYTILIVTWKSQLPGLEPVYSITRPRTISSAYSH